MARFLVPLTSFQRKMFIESEEYSFVAPKNLEAKVVSYDLAIMKIKMALVTAIIRKAKASEKAYICLYIVYEDFDEIDTSFDSKNILRLLKTSRVKY